MCDQLVPCSRCLFYEGVHHDWPMKRDKRYYYKNDMDEQKNEENMNIIEISS